MNTAEWIDVVGQAAVSISGLTAAVAALWIANRQARDALTLQRSRSLVIVEAILAVFSTRSSPLFRFNVDSEGEDSSAKLLTSCNRALQEMQALESALRVFGPADLPSVEAVVAFTTIIAEVDDVQRQLRDLASRLAAHAELGRPTFVLPNFSTYTTNIEGALTALESERDKLRPTNSG